MFCEAQLARSSLYRQTGEDNFPEKEAGARSRVGLLGRGFPPEVALKPLSRQACHFFQGTRLLEQMGRSGDHRQMFLDIELFKSLLVEIDDNVVEPAYNEQGWRLYLW